MHSSLILPMLLAIPSVAADPAAYVFENLGRPLQSKPVEIEAVTQDGQGRYRAWGIVKSPDQYGVVGVDVESGKSTWVDLERFGGGTSIQLTRARSGVLYLYAGDPGHFLKYDPKSGALTDLGVPVKPASFTLGSVVAPDGRFYVGTYPQARVARLDPETERVDDLGPLSADPRVKYVSIPAISDDDVLYVPLGMHHAELWALDNRTGQRRQTLPEGAAGNATAVALWTANDGQVYGRADGRVFRCRPDSIEMVADEPPRREPAAAPRLAGDELAVQLTGRGELLLRRSDTGAERRVRTDFGGVSVSIYSVACERAGRIYGGGFQPANLFAFDTATGRAEDLGRHNGGRIQIYDILSHPRGLFLSSYVGANLDLFVPETGERRHLAQLSETQQERIQQLALGPDGRVYGGSTPVKGRLGGGLVRINPADLSVKSWRNVVPNQSVNSVVGVPQTGEVFLAATIGGGTSAIPSEEEACVALWSAREEAVVWTGRPVPGSTFYGRAALAGNGLIYGLARRQSVLSFYVLDPAKRQVVHTAPLPVKTLRWPEMAPTPPAPRGCSSGWETTPCSPLTPPTTRCESLPATHPSAGPTASTSPRRAPSTTVRAGS